MHKKEDSASPTVSLEVIMITSDIEAHKVRDIATIYIPGEYLKLEWYEDVIMILKVILEELLVNQYNLISTVNKLWYRRE